MSDIFEPTRLGWLQSVQRSRETDVYGLALAASLSVLAGSDHVVRASLRELAETQQPDPASSSVSRLLTDPFHRQDLNARFVFQGSSRTGRLIQHAAVKQARFVFNLPGIC